MKYNELNERVIKWANDKGILEKATSLTQIDKTIEEVQETRDALLAHENYLDEYYNSKGVLVNTKEEIKDGFGDQLVTILIGCKLKDLNPLECLETALNVIEKRTGKMVGGTFIKDK